MKRVYVYFAVLLALGPELSCRAKKPNPEGVSTQAPAADEAPSAARKVAVSHELFDELGMCEARYRGLAIDISSAASDFSRPFRVGPYDDVPYESRAGESVAAFRRSAIDFDVWMDRAAAGVEISARLEGGTARSVNLLVDGVVAGTRTLTHGSMSVLRFAVPQATLERGRHTLGLRFSGKAKPEEPFARGSWLRVYLAGDADPKYPAPTGNTLVTAVSIGGDAKRAVSLRAPGSLRCGLMPAPGVRVRVDVGYRGAGSADAELRAQTADGRSVRLWGAKLEDADDSPLTAVDVSLEPFAGQLIGLEFAAEASTSNGRVVFAEPRLERLDAPVASATARNVVVVVAGGLDRAGIPPWGDRKGLGNAFLLADQGVAFDGYRASSSIATSVLATLLTGLPASMHGVLSLSGRVPARFPLMSRMLRERASNSALFSNVPTTQAAFGFARDWGHFESHSPLEDMPATAPVLAGADWLRKDGARGDTAPRLLVVHVSGGHPPWDISNEELALILPKDYEGPIDARRGAITLHEYRARAAAGRKTLSPADWVRVEALQALSVRKLDTSLGSLFRYLQEANQWDDTLFILMGDVGVGDRPEIPFAPDGALTEGRLAAPLIVKFPHGRRPRAHVNNRVSTGSVARAISEALGLNPAAHNPAPSLLALAELGDPTEGSRVLSRTMNSYAFYLGRYVLRGTLGQVPSLFDLEVDPAAQTDLAAEQPFLVEWMWRLCVQEMKRGATSSTEEREVAEMDAETRAALAAYGI